jgi:hypothetical protein
MAPQHGSELTPGIIHHSRAGVQLPLRVRLEFSLIEIYGEQSIINRYECISWDKLLSKNYVETKTQSVGCVG